MIRSEQNSVRRSASLSWELCLGRRFRISDRNFREGSPPTMMFGTPLSQRGQRAGLPTDGPNQFRRSVASTSQDFRWTCAPSVVRRLTNVVAGGQVIVVGLCVFRVESPAAETWALSQLPLPEPELR